MVRLAGVLLVAAISFPAVPIASAAKVKTPAKKLTKQNAKQNAKQNKGPQRVDGRSSRVGKTRLNLRIPTTIQSAKATVLGKKGDVYQVKVTTSLRPFLSTGHAQSTSKTVGLTPGKWVLVGFGGTKESPIRHRISISKEGKILRESEHFSTPPSGHFGASQIAGAGLEVKIQSLQKNRSGQWELFGILSKSTGTMEFTPKEVQQFRSRPDVGFKPAQNLEFQAKGTHIRLSQTKKSGDMIHAQSMRFIMTMPSDTMVAAQLPQFGNRQVDIKVSPQGQASMRVVTID